MSGSLFNPNFVPPLVHETQKLIGGVKRLLVLPCSLPVEAFVETLVPAALGAFYSIAEPDPKEVYHKVTGKSFVCDLTSTAEKAYKFGDFPEGKFTRFAFKSLAVFDIATWWFFLADIAGEGLANWTSFAYQQRQCNNNNDPNYGSGPAYAGAMYGGDWSGNSSFVYEPPSKFAPVSFAQITLAPGWSGGVAGSWAFSVSPEILIPTATRIIDIASGQMFDSDQAAEEHELVKRANHVWTKVRNHTSEVMVISVQNIAFVASTVQVFIDHDRSHCTQWSYPP